MFEPEMVTFLTSGCSTIVGTVGPDGDPHAARGWGLDVVDADGGRVLLVLDADDQLTVRHLTDHGAVAITCADVPTLRSVQLKGHSLGVEPASEADQDRARRFCDAFFSDVVDVDGTERSLLERLVPERFAVGLVQIDELFDQTPGPGAGAPLAAGPGEIARRIE